METIFVNLLGDVFTIAGLFYDDLQSVSSTIVQLKEVLEKAGIAISEKSIEELTLHLENLASVSGHKLGRAHILTEEEERVLQDYYDDLAKTNQMMMEAEESEKELQQLLEEEIPTEEEAMKEADEFEREWMEKGEIF